MSGASLEEMAGYLPNAVLELRNSVERPGLALKTQTAAGPEAGPADERITMDSPDSDVSSSEFSSSDVSSQWAREWLDAVADGSVTMSQRRLSSVEARGGGLAAVKVLAEQRGVHLLRLEDDQGNALVAASTKPFEVVC